MNFKQLLFMSCTSSLLFASCGNQEKGEAYAHYLPTDFDSTIAVGNDFYQYSNGGWLATHPIPGDKSRYNTFDVLNDDNLNRLRDIVESCNPKASVGSNEQKIGDYYRMAMDTDRIEAVGITPILPIIDKIKTMSYDVKDSSFAANIAYFHLYLHNPFFAFGSTPDAKNSSMTIAGLYQDGLGLPNRDYYFDESEKGKQIIAGFKKMIANYLELLGETDVEARAEAVFLLEKEMAAIMNTKVENRDPQATYNKMSVAELQELSKEFNWPVYFDAVSVKIDEVDVAQPRYFKGVFSIVAKTNPSVLSDYLLYGVINKLAGYLPEKYALVSFDFYSKQLSGVSERLPLWKRSLNKVQVYLGQPLGQLFVEKHFSENAKNRMKELIEQLRIAFGQRIDNLAWMSDTTKKAAHDKLAAMTVKVGYPDVWEDYSRAEVDKSLSLVENYIQLTLFASQKMISEIGQPVDKEKWHMTPQTVNAYYSPLSNEIVFPAGILQPPFFYAEGDDAVNYGAIGVVIGHEMTHGFDDSGRQFDKEGNLQDWWTEKDAVQFKAATARLRDRFSQVTVIDDMKCNGELTLGENIADLGGLNIAHQAFLNTLKEGTEDPKLDGLTYDQRFLYAYSRIWAGNYRDEYLRMQVITDPHANGKYRVNVQLPLLDFFYTAFGIQEADAMYLEPEDRIVIW